MWKRATGIAAAISHFLDNVIFYQNTIRGYQEEEEYLFFTESHSYATDQTPRASKVDECIKQIDRIEFIDDEVTAGSTICKLINVIKDRYSVHGMRCSIVLILNSVPRERIDLLSEGGIDFIYLSELPFEFNKESIMDVEYERSRDININSEAEDILNELVFISLTNARNVSEFRAYDEENRRFTEFMESALREEHYSEALNRTVFIRQYGILLTNGVIHIPKGKQNKRYTAEFKQTVVETMHKEGLSYKETERQFGLPHNRAANWERIYLKEGVEGFQKERRGRGGKGGRPAKQLKPEVEEDLIAEVQRLRAEIAYLKKLNALVLEEECQSRKRK